MLKVSSIYHVLEMCQVGFWPKSIRGIDMGCVADVAELPYPASRCIYE